MIRFWISAACAALLTLPALAAVSPAPQPEREMRAAGELDPVAEEARARAYFTDSVLLTQAGEQVQFYSDVLKDRVVLINTIYTNCQDACPLQTQKLIAALDRLPAGLFGKRVFFVSISTDPERDSPQAMAEFARQQSADQPGWLFLTGEPGNIRTVLQRLGQFAPDPQMHSTLLIAGNVPRRHWIKIKPNEPPAAIAYKLEDLATEQ